VGNEAKFSISADPNAAIQAMRHLAQSTQQGVNQIKGAFDQLNVVSGKLVAGFAIITGVLAGGKAFKDTIEETVNLTKESIALGKQFGVTATEGSVLKKAMGDVFVTQEDLSKAADHMTQTLRKNEDAFVQLGVKTHDSNGHFRSTMDIMQDVNSRLLQFREGTDRNVEGQKIYGKSWGEVSSVLKLSREQIESSRAKAAELNLVVGEESVAANERYRGAMNDASDVMLGLKKTIGDALIPSLTEMAEWFSSIGPTAVQVMKGAMVGLVLAFQGLRVIVVTTFDILKVAIQGMVVLFMTLADVGSKALKFDFSGAKQAWLNGWDQIKDIGKAAFDDIDETVQDATAKVADSMTRAFSKETPIAKRPAQSGPVPTATALGADDRFRIMVNELEKVKIAEGRFRQEDLGADLSYWENKLALTGSKTKIDKELRLKIEHEIFDVKKGIAAQERQLSEQQITTDEQMAELSLENRKNALNAQIELSNVSIRKQADIARDLENQRYQIERQGLLERLKLVEGDRVARKKIQDELLVAERRHANQESEIARDATIQYRNFWQGVINPIVNTMTQSVQQMLQGTMTMHQAIKNVGRTILEEWIRIQTEKVEKYLAAEAATTASAVMGAETRAVAEETSAKRGLIATIAAALKTIAINAVKVISGVWAAISSIPIVGPFLAPVLAIAAGAAVYGLASRISSARGGYNIPKGVNPVTQLHEDEMVLPAPIADTIRRSMGTEGGRARPAVNHFNINAVDAPSFLKMLQDPQAQRVIAAGIARRQRSFDPAFAST
jgi:hypothetical protein